MAGQTPARGFSVGALFAGIGGIEEGFRRAGYSTAFFCEADPAASSVLKARFGHPVFDDVSDLPDRVENLPHVDVLTGFPCQDLSQAGSGPGIRGEKSGLVAHMFRLLEALDSRPNRPSWLVIENVINMLYLDRGEAMRFLTQMLEVRGCGWAYPVGLLQGRKRVLLVASRRLPSAPRRILFAGLDIVEGEQ